MDFIMEIYYCKKCRSRVSSYDITAGKGMMTDDGETYCRSCIKELGLDDIVKHEVKKKPAKKKGTSRIRQTGTHRTTGLRRPVQGVLPPSQAQIAAQKKKNANIVIATIGAVLLAIIIIAVVVNSGNKSTGTTKKQSTDAPIDLSKKGTDSSGTQTSGQNTNNNTQTGSRIDRTNELPPETVPMIDTAEIPAAPQQVFTDELGWNTLITEKPKDIFRTANGKMEYADNTYTSALAVDKNLAIESKNEFLDHELGLVFAVSTRCSLRIPFRISKKSSGFFYIQDVKPGMWHTVNLMLQGGTAVKALYDNNDYAVIKGTGIILRKTGLSQKGKFGMTVQNKTGSTSNLVIHELAYRGDCIGKKETITISGKWKFKKGDDQAWKDPAFDDSSWTEIDIGTEWEKALGEAYDGYAWYRKKVILPAISPKALIRTEMDDIDDQDWTYINGIQIGSKRGSRDNRKYTVPVGTLKPGEPMIIAIRVLDTGGDGGIKNSKAKIIIEDIKDYDYQAASVQQPEAQPQDTEKEKEAEQNTQQEPAPVKQADVLFEDNFDNWKDLRKGTWDDKIEANGNIARSQTRKHTGTHSLKVQAVGDKSEAYILKKIEGLNDCFVRFYVFLPPTFWDDFIHQTFIFNLQGVPGNFDAFNLYLLNEGAFTETAIIQGRDGTSWPGTYARAEVPSNRWVPIEIYIPKAGEEGTSDLYIDGEKKRSFKFKQTLNFKDVKIGITSRKKGCPPFYIDTFSISKGRLGDSEMGNGKAESGNKATGSTTTPSPQPSPAEGEGASSELKYLAYWGFEGTSNTVVMDMGEKELNGVITGAERVEGKIGKGLKFKGKGDRIDLSKRFTPSAQGSISFWIKPDAFPHQLNRILGGSDEFEICIRPDGAIYNQLGYSGKGGLLSNKPVPVGEWTHIVCTWNTENKKNAVFINGTRNKEAVKINAPLSQIPFCIGSRPDVHKESFQGIMDEIYLFDRVITNEEAQQLAGISEDRSQKTENRKEAGAANEAPSQIAGKVIFEDGFEKKKNLKEGWDNNILKNEGKSSTSKDNHSGKTSAKFWGKGDSESYLVKNLGAQQELYIRFYVRIREDFWKGFETQNDKKTFITIIANNGHGVYGAFWKTVWGSDGFFQWTPKGGPGAGDWPGIFSAWKFKLNDWTCVEIHLPKPAADSKITLWIDGKEVGSKVSDLTDIKTWNTLNIGLMGKSPEKSRPKIYIDDLVISDQRIGN